MSGYVGNRYNELALKDWCITWRRRSDEDNRKRHGHAPANVLDDARQRSRYAARAAVLNSAEIVMEESLKAGRSGANFEKDRSKHVRCLVAGRSDHSRQQRVNKGRV